MSKQILKVLFFLATFFMLPNFASAATWYVRTDGGNLTECTGQSDAAYPGSGTAQDCAVSHPFFLLKPNGAGGLSGAALLQGGDTAIIDEGEYMMGIGAPNSSACNTAWAYSCTLPPIPSGTDADHPTKIYGKNYDTKSTAAPQLWGLGRSTQILNLTGSSNVEIGYLEITDHSACIYDSLDALTSCNDSAPYDKPHARVGLYAIDSSNVLLKDVNIHGVSKTGIMGGRLTDWTLDNVTLRGNGYVGWDGDVGHGVLDSATDSSNHGTMLFKSSKIEYSGCGENYPSTDIYGCNSRYGDGLGCYQDGASWVFENTEISHNTSDGLDLLYHVGPSRGAVTIKNSKFEGNAGQQVKISTNASVENTVIIGNCDFFHNNPIADQAHIGNCRATGTALVISGWGTVSNLGPNLTPGTNSFSIINSTLIGDSTVLVETEGDSCDGSEKYVSRNNIIVGLEGWYKKNNGEPNWKPNYFYLDGSDGNGTGPCGPGDIETSIKLDEEDSLQYNTKISACPNSDNVICADPQLTDIPSFHIDEAIYTHGDRWNVVPQAGSPALDKSSLAVGATVLGSVVIPSVDILGNSRPFGAGIDWGAYEVGSGADTTAPAAPSGLSVL